MTAAATSVAGRCPFCGGAWVAELTTAAGVRERDCADCRRGWRADQESGIRAEREAAAAAEAATPCVICEAPVGEPAASPNYQIDDRGFAHVACADEQDRWEWIGRAM